MFPVPPLFNIIKEQSGTSWEEMYRVFNMGHRFEVYLSPEDAETLIGIAGEFNLQAKVIGYCTGYSGKRLTITDTHGVYEY